MGRLSQSWRLTKKSWGVLRQDKELMLFPILSSIASVLVLVSFAIPIWIAFSGSTTDALSSSSSGSYPIWVYPIAFAFYFVTSLVTIYFNAALIGAAMVRLKGGNPSLSDGFRAANSRLGKILGWAAINATVGMILRAIQERAGILGAIVAGLGGLAWQLLTYFVIPILLFEDLSPIPAVKRSVRIFKDRWGEQVLGNYGIGLASMLFGLLSIPIFIAGAIAIAGGLTIVGIAVILLGVAYIVCLGIITSAMQGIYNTALYRFATEGEAGGGFTADELANTFKPKKGPVPPGWGYGAGGVQQYPPQQYPVQQYPPQQYPPQQ